MMLKQTSVTLVVLNNFKNDSRVLKEAQTLKNKGYCVKVVALHEEPLLEYDSVSGIFTHRIIIKTKSWSKRKIVQVIKYIEFMFKFIKKYKNSDIIHCNDLDTLPIGVFIKLFFNKKVKIVYDAHEFEINQKPYQSKISIKLLYFLEKFLIKYADACFTVGVSIANEYCRTYHIKPTVLYNAPRLIAPKKTNFFREKFCIDKKSIIMLYQGGLSRGRGLELLLDAFMVRKDDKVVIIFMGYGELEGYIKDLAAKCGNIFYHEAVPSNELLDYTSAADIATVSYVNNNCLNYYYCMPNKFFEYTMAGLPVLVSNLKDLSENVKKYNLGVVVDEDTPYGINNAIDKLLQMDFEVLKANALKFAKENSWEIQEKKMLAVYEELKNGC